MSGNGALEARQQLQHLAKSHGDDARALRRARSALMWLAYATKPLEARDLLLLLDVEECTTLSEVENLVSFQHGRLSPDNAAVVLEDLLDGVVKVRRSDGGIEALRLSIITALTFGGSKGGHDFGALRSGQAEAQRLLAKVCLIISASSRPYLAKSNQQRELSGAAAYAWSEWTVHLLAAKDGLEDEECAKCFDMLIGSICIDILQTLSRLCSYFAGPLTFPSTLSAYECNAIAQDCQKALDEAVAAIAVIARQDRYAAHSRPQTTSKMLQVSTSTQQTRGHSTTPQDRAKETHRKWRRGARALKNAARTLSQPVLATTMRHDFDENGASIQNIEATAAVFENIHEKFAVSDIKEKVHIQNMRHPEPVLKHFNLAARAVLATRNLSRAEPQEYTVNPPRSLARRESSFARVPSYMHTPNDPTASSMSIIPSSLRRLIRKQLLSRLAGSWAIQPDASIQAFSSSAFTGAMCQQWTQAKATLLANGYFDAFVHLMAAVLLNHVRRLLIPWLGAYIYRDTIEDLRIGLSHPHVFLDDALGVSWLEMLFAFAQKYIFDLVGAFAMSTMQETSVSPPASPILAAQGHFRKSSSPLRVRDGEAKLSIVAYSTSSPENLRVMRNIAKITYLVWSLTALEYMFDRTINTCTFVMTYAELLLGTQADKTALVNVLREHSLKSMVLGWQVVIYAKDGIVPLVWGAILCAVLGQPGLLLSLGTVFGGVLAFLKYRSRLIVAMELGGLALILVLAVIIIVLLAKEFWEDPLGMKESTARCRRKAGAARRLADAIQRRVTENHVHMGV